VAIATQLEGEQRDLAKAKQLLDSVNKKTFEDKVSFYEAQALVHSASGSEKELQRSLKPPYCLMNLLRMYRVNCDRVRVPLSAPCF